MVDKVRVGFVGCGGIARQHLKSLVKNPHAELASFCDINIERARITAEKYGSESSLTFDDAEEMFDSVRLDAAYFCIPPYAHGVEMEAVKRDIPFFVEKPVNLYLDQAERIMRAVEERKLLTSVGYMNRYRRGVQLVREVLREDPPILILGGWIGRPPSPEAPIFKWWIRKEKSGGQFHEQVTHTVDLVRFICGEISEVQAYPARGFNRGMPPTYNIEDASVVNLKLENGAIGNLWASCSSLGGGGGVSLNIYSNRTTALFKGWDHSLRLLRAGEEPEDIPGEPNIFEIEDEAFIEAVREGDPSRVMCQYADGVETLRVTLAANLSMETGKPVKVR
ncbi:hypothetical protein DRO55_00185 [Candidatus Bathyarchaeota archaeon]|nr:MAG: hypothetical protein DRO55_00185 [Candidatus Bathyarchaeota archaeon]